MRSYILKKFDTISINEIIKTFGLEKDKYNWVFTGVDEGENKKVFNRDINILNSKELDELLKYKKIKMEYGVITGILKDELINFKDSYIPYSNGNIDLWCLNPKPQHSQAKVEIVIYDNKYTIIHSSNYRLLKKFKANFEGVSSLKKFNKELWNSKILE